MIRTPEQIAAEDAATDVRETEGAARFGAVLETLRADGFLSDNDVLEFAGRGQGFFQTRPSKYDVADWLYWQAYDAISRRGLRLRVDGYDARYWVERVLPVNNPVHICEKPPRATEPPATGWPKSGEVSPVSHADPYQYGRYELPRHW